MQKEETIAGTMKKFMATEPSVKEYATYKALNDAVGAVHNLPAGKCQALAGPKAWAWHADTTTGKWRPATPEEFADRQAKAAGKVHGGPRSKVLSDADRAALDAQVTALEAVNNPALSGLLAGLKAQQEADDTARKGSLKDRLQAQVDRLGLQWIVEFLEVATAAAEAPAAESEAPEAPEA